MGIGNRGIDYSGKVPLADLSPDLIISSFLEIDFRAHAAAGRDVLICDMDNTVVDGCSDEIYSESLASIQAARHHRFVRQLGICSNIQVPWPPAYFRVKRCAAKLGADDSRAAIWPVAKPDPYPLFVLMKRMGVDPSRVIYIGDQVKNDILTARRAGVKVILRYPAFGADPWYRHKKRERERQVIQTWLGPATILA